MLHALYWSLRPSCLSGLASYYRVAFSIHFRLRHCPITTPVLYPIDIQMHLKSTCATSRAIYIEPGMKLNRTEHTNLKAKIGIERAIGGSVSKSTNNTKRYIPTPKCK
jgi:hypothetical protein